MLLDLILVLIAKELTNIINTHASYLNRSYDFSNILMKFSYAHTLFETYSL